MPRVSIGLPVYNGENFLEAALTSLLDQTFEDFELIISDNASTDKTEEVCRSFVARDKRIRYFRNETNLGASYNFNRVFELSSAEYFKWAAHDDVCARTFLEKMVSMLDRDPSVVLCFSKTKFVNDAGQFLKDYSYNLRVNSAKPHQRFIDLAIRDHIVVEIFGVIRADALRRTPLIANYAGSDRVLLGELALSGRFFEVPEYLFLHREHSLRSTEVFPSLHSATQWFDPGRTGVIVFPTWRILLEHLASIRRSSLGLADRVTCYLEMARWLRARRKRLTGDLRIGMKRLSFFENRRASNQISGENEVEHP
jgi:glycosyltransferase involved in cell wall biosynthesis